MMDGSKAGSGYITKDSGVRAKYDSGMVRDSEAGKPRFDLLFPLDIPFKEQMMTRFADLMERGARKYDERNWEKARGEEELQRYRSSALRHLIQWLTDEDDEDHAAAVMFNILAGETVLAREDEDLTGVPLGVDPMAEDLPPLMEQTQDDRDEIAAALEHASHLCHENPLGNLPCSHRPRKGEYVTCITRQYPHQFDPDDACNSPVPAEGC